MSSEVHPRDRQSTEQMQRVTVRVPKPMLSDLDGLVDKQYPNRSEALRAAILQLVDNE